MERRRTYDIVRANMKGMAKQEPSAIIARYTTGTLILLHISEI